MPAPVPLLELPAVDDVGIERIGNGVSILFHADGPPFAERDVPLIPAALDAGRAALLLPAADAIGKGVVGADVIELRGRLVVPGAPRLAAVHRDDGPLVGGDENR